MKKKTLCDMKIHSTNFY